MLSEICKELNNWFDTKRLFGKFTISDGVLQDVEILEGQYYRIVGSVFNDGVYQHTSSQNIIPLHDESFDGAVWLMAVPSDVLKLSKEVEDWVSKYAEAENSPYQSESFGGYSYTKAAGQNGSNGATWQKVFGARLNKWRKISCC